MQLPWCIRRPGACLCQCVLHSDAAFRCCIQMLHSDASFGCFVRMLHSDASFKRFIQMSFSTAQLCFVPITCHHVQATLLTSTPPCQHKFDHTGNLETSQAACSCTDLAVGHQLGKASAAWHSRPHMLSVQYLCMYVCMYLYVCACVSSSLMHGPAVAGTNIVTADYNDVLDGHQASKNMVAYGDPQ